MPEMQVDIAWPDGATQRWYSPSLVVEDHLSSGATYAVSEFVERSRTALVEGSSRVEKIYGYPCSRAAASLSAIENSASRYPADGLVEIIAFHR